MKIAGEKIHGVNTEIIVIPRTDENGNAKHIVFKAQAIMDFESFRKLVPEPQPPKMRKRGGIVVEDVEDKNYKLAMQEYIDKRFDWLIIESLRATKDLEWEKVDYSDSNTWKYYKSELKESGFSEYEIGRITKGVLSANCLDEGKLEEARKSFLAGAESLQDQLLSQNGEK